MPTPGDLRRSEVDGQVFLSVGSRVLFSYAADDAGLRNLAAVTLPEMGFTGRRVARVLQITEQYVSTLRGRARHQGSAGLMRARGRPSALAAREVARAGSWRGAGQSDTKIAARLGVHPTTVARALVEVPRPGSPAHEPEEAGLGEDVDAGQRLSPVPAHAEDDPTAETPDEDTHSEDAESEAPVPEPAAGFTGFSGSERIGSGSHGSRYAGAMLLYAYLYRVGAEAIFAGLKGGPARRYDDLAVLCTAVVGFALGIDTVEGAKHLRRAEAGPVTGLERSPELATLRTRLAALADGSDPLELQRRFAAGMLAVDPAEASVYFVDDHFKAYAGALPVGKGWNTKRRHAEPGIDDTMLVDARGRAVVFGTGEPSSLAANLPGVLAQLRAVIGPDAAVMLAFDRGGAFPAAFTACRAAGAAWVTYRRRPLAETTVTPRRSWTVRDGKRITMMLADETVDINGYGEARQLTLFEAGAPVLQVLTSDLTARGADLVCWLRARWRIENMFKYAVAHNGIDTLADYAMDIGPDTRKVTNPARTAARKKVNQAEADLVAAERALPQMLAGPATPKQMNAALPGLHKQIADAKTALADAKTALRPIPAKVLATDLDPDAKRARPRIERRGLQMVLRLLAFNAEAWLADHLNAYLADPDEYRAITRNLLHLGGRIDYTPSAITVRLDRPDSPRVAGALHLLTEELNATMTRLPGDRRPVTYQLNPAQVSTLNAPLLAEV